MDERERQTLMAELERRVEARQKAGDYDVPWLDAKVEPRDPLTPVDRYLQTASVPVPTALRDRVYALRTPHADEHRALLDQRLRDALAWLTLALTAEEKAREGVSTALGGVSAALEGVAETLEGLSQELNEEVHARSVADDADGLRIGNLEQDIQALGFAIGERVWRLEDDRRWTASNVLRDIYRDLIAPTAAPLDLASVESRVFSQNGEDGILLHLFSLIGATDRRFVEIGVEDGRECNTANLALNFGWSGVMIDRDPGGVASAHAFYGSRPRTRETVRVVERHVTREGIDDLLIEIGAEGDIDLLSIDIDGNDLWTWEAVERTHPRVVAIEYNATFGPDRSVSIPYDPDFDRMAAHPSGFYHGASLTALTRLAERKGYVLAGCDSNGVNAFFVRSDCAEGVITNTVASAAWRPIRERGPRSTREQFALVSNLPLVVVP